MLPPDFSIFSMSLLGSPSEGLPKFQDPPLSSPWAEGSFPPWNPWRTGSGGKIEDKNWQTGGDDGNIYNEHPRPAMVK